MSISISNRDVLNTFAREFYELNGEGEISDSVEWANDVLGETRLVGHGSGRACFTLSPEMVSGGSDEEFVVKFAHSVSIDEENGVAQNTCELETWGSVECPFLLPVVASQDRSEWESVQRDTFTADNEDTVTGPLWIVMPLGIDEFRISSLFWEWADVVRERCEEFVLESDVRTNNVVMWNGSFRLCDYGIQTRSG